MVYRDAANYFRLDVILVAVVNNQGNSIASGPLHTPVVYEAAAIALAMVAFTKIRTVKKFREACAHVQDLIIDGHKVEFYCHGAVVDVGGMAFHYLTLSNARVSSSFWSTFSCAAL